MRMSSLKKNVMCYRAFVSPEWVYWLVTLAAVLVPVLVGGVLWLLGVPFAVAVAVMQIISAVIGLLRTIFGFAKMWQYRGVNTPVMLRNAKVVAASGAIVIGLNMIIYACLAEWYRTLLAG
jgi:hypothetical protein